MKRSILLLFALAGAFAFTHDPALRSNRPGMMPLAFSDFASQLNCNGTCPDIAQPFPVPPAVSGNYPSPLNTAEQAAIYVPNSFRYRGFDNSYPVVVGGNYTVPANGGAETEGRLAVGGNLVIDKTNYGVAQSGGGTFVVGAGGSYGVAVGGAISGSGSIAVGFNGSGPPGNQPTYVIRSGGAKTLATGSAGGTVSIQQNQGSAGVDVAAIIDGMRLSSAYLCTLPATGSVGPTFTGTNASQEVFNLNNPSTSSGFNFGNIAPGATIIVNVRGAGAQTVNWFGRVGRVNDPNIGTSDPDAQVYNVVWNFCEATDVTISSASGFHGTVLVPNGNLTLNTPNFNGRIFVSGNLTHSLDGSEIHNYPFVGSIPPPPLPVTLRFFQAEGSLDRVDLSWQTESEEAFSRFVVEYGTNAKSWEGVGTVPAGGSKFAGKLYQFTHAPLQPGTHYYRLKMVDSDGTFEYSRIRSVTLDGSPRLVVYPNPATNQFTLAGVDNPTNQPVRVAVYSPEGRLIRQFRRGGNEALDFAVETSWPTGLLLVRVEVENGAAKSFRLFKQ